MTPFRERNPVVIGAISLAVIALLMLAAFRASDLPLIGGGDVYYAEFDEAGGLKVNDEVRIAGVRVGKVESIELDDDVVKVGIKVKTDSAFGVDTRAEIKVATILGDMFVALVPAGDDQLEADSTIPVERTSSPYDVVDAFEGLAETTNEIDTDQLAKAFTTLADLGRNTPEEFRGALDGLSRLSSNVAARNDQLDSLLTNLDRVSTVLAERDDDIISLMESGDVLFRAIVARRDSVHDLLVSTRVLSKELTALVRQTRDDLNPALESLDSVLQVLNKNEDNLDNSLRLLAPFYRVFASTLGNGPWFDTYIYNLPPAPALPTLGGGGGARGGAR